MLTKAASKIALSSTQVVQILKRNVGISSVVLAKTDPIQQLFADKVKEYYKKKK